VSVEGSLIAIMRTEGSEGSEGSEGPLNLDAGCESTACVGEGDDSRVWNKNETRTQC
jgi:hypothetical protein